MFVDWMRRNCRLVQEPGEVAHIIVSRYLTDSGTDDSEGVLDELDTLGMMLDRKFRGDSRTRLELDSHDHSGLIGDTNDV